MKQGFSAANIVDEAGNPAGGTARCTGIDIRWQDGPLGRGPARKDPNGAFVETVIAIAIQRLEFYQMSRFACTANLNAIVHLQDALGFLQDRTRLREEREVEGTHTV